MIALLRKLLVLPFSLLSKSLHGELWLIFVVLHAVWLLAGIANMSPPNRQFADGLEQWQKQGGWSSASVLAGRPFHYTYESLALKSVLLIDMPSMLVSVPITVVADLILKRVFGVSLYMCSYVYAAVLFLMSSLQWCIMALFVEHQLSFGPKRGKVLLFLRKRRWAIILGLVLAGCILVPYLNFRSAALGGIRHGGISFG